MHEDPSSASPAPGVPVTVRGIVHGTPERVFAAWTTAETMRAWGVATFVNEPRPGGRFRQETGEGDDVHVVSGEYREFHPGRRLVMTWDYTGSGAQPSHAVVTVDLRADGTDATEVTVTEEPVDPGAVGDAVAAWRGALGALDALLGDERG